MKGWTGRIIRGYSTLHNSRVPHRRVFSGIHAKRCCLRAVEDLINMGSAKGSWGTLLCMLYSYLINFQKLPSAQTWARYARILRVQVYMCIYIYIHTCDFADTATRTKGVSITRFVYSGNQQ